MKQGKDITGCRFFGYQPASADLKDKPQKDHAKKIAIRAKHKADCLAIKAAGWRSSNYGYQSREIATQYAKTIEDASGIEMMVFNHDYM